MSKEAEKRIPYCPRAKQRHPHADPRPLGQDRDGTWRCGHCGYTEPHKPEYVIGNAVFQRKLEAEGAV